MPHVLVASFDILVSIGALVLFGFLFRLAMPRRSGGKRWFIGTFWEPYIAVLLVCGLVLSFGFLALRIADFFA
jgi:hypothetical protein